jgi:hypothetical protein
MSYGLAWQRTRGSAISNVQIISLYLTEICPYVTKPPPPKWWSRKRSERSYCGQHTNSRHSCGRCKVGGTMINGGALRASGPNRRGCRSSWFAPTNQPNNWQSNKLTICSTLLLDKLTVPHLLTQSALYGTQRSINYRGWVKPAPCIHPWWHKHHGTQRNMCLNTKINFCTTDFR